jgi:hypothetical protein
MSSDPNKKSARTFQCRDVLWETFEQMARELECSVDYLVNEAMKQYARQRSYGSRTPYPGAQAAGASQPPLAPPMTSPPMAPTGQPPQMMSHSAQYTSAPPPPPPLANTMPPTNVMRSTQSTAAAPPGHPSLGQTGGQSSRLPPPPMQRGSNLPPPGSLGPPPQQRPPSHGSAAPPPAYQPRATQTAHGASSAPRSAPPPRSVPPPIPRGGTPAPFNPQQNGGFPQPQANAAQLAVIYQGDKVAVNKDRFVIGRGKQSSDLTLKDPNVSRQHAMIEFQNGVYFMVDMGSTNGVEYNGQRIARKQIAEGDVFRICDHDLRFTYR